MFPTPSISQAPPPPAAVSPSGLFPVALPPVSATPPAGSVIQALPISSASGSLLEALDPSAAPIASPQEGPGPAPQVGAKDQEGRSLPAGHVGAASPDIQPQSDMGIVREESVPGGRALSSPGMPSAGAPSPLPAINPQSLAQVRVSCRTLISLIFFGRRVMKDGRLRQFHGRVQELRA